MQRHIPINILERVSTLVRVEGPGELRGQSCSLWLLPTFLLQFGRVLTELRRDFASLDYVFELFVGQVFRVQRLGPKGRKLPRLALVRVVGRRFLEW